MKEEKLHNVKALIEKNDYQQALTLMLDERNNEQNDWNLYSLIAFCIREIDNLKFRLGFAVRLFL